MSSVDQKSPVMANRLVPSLCSYCGTGCGVLHQVVDGRLAGTLPNKSYPVNEGCLCIKGWNLHEHVLSPNRLTRPLLRKEGKLAPASWDSAVAFAAGGLRKIVDEYGPGAVAMLSSAKATNEENYLAQKFMRCVVGGNNIDHCARL